MDVAKIRTRAGQVVWVVCVIFALILAGGALLVALDNTNPSNALYQWVMDACDALDFGVFSRQNGLFEFSGKNAATKDGRQIVPHKTTGLMREGPKKHKTAVIVPRMA